MSTEIPMEKIEELAALTQEAADDRHGDKDKRLRNRRRRRLARRALACAAGGAATVFVGGPLLDRGLDQIDRNASPPAPESEVLTVTAPAPKGTLFYESYVGKDGQKIWYRISRPSGPDLGN